MGVKRMQRAKLAAAYLLLALAAALGWLYSCLPDRVYLEPGQALYLPRFAWVEPQRGHGSRNVASTRAVGSYQTTLTLGGWLPIKTIRAVVTERPRVTVCGTPFGVKMFSEVDQSIVPPPTNKRASQPEDVWVTNVIYWSVYRSPDGEWIKGGSPAGPVLTPKGSPWADAWNRIG